MAETSINTFHPDPNRWKIWFEVFRNGRKTGSGIYHQDYKYASSAVRRATRLYGKPRGDVTYKWKVSKTNPFVKGD